MSLQTDQSVCLAMLMTGREPREVRRKKILDAALECFSTNGYHETTMDDIVAKAGLTKGGVYWYFEGKREIFIVLIERHLEEEKAFWRELSDGDRSASDFLVRAGLSYLKLHFKDEWTCPFIAEFVAESYRDPKLRKKVGDVYGELRSIIREAFSQAIKKGELRKFDSKSLSTVMIALFSGLINLYWISGKKWIAAKSGGCFPRRCLKESGRRRSDEDDWCYWRNELGVDARVL